MLLPAVVQVDSPVLSNKSTHLLLITNCPYTKAAFHDEPVAAEGIPVRTSLLAAGQLQRPCQSPVLGWMVHEQSAT